MHHDSGDPYKPDPFAVRKALRTLVAVLLGAGIIAAVLCLDGCTSAEIAAKADEAYSASEATASGLAEAESAHVAAVEGADAKARLQVAKTARAQFEARIRAASRPNDDAAVMREYDAVETERAGTLADLDVDRKARLSRAIYEATAAQLAVVLRISGNVAMVAHYVADRVAMIKAAATRP